MQEVLWVSNGSDSPSIPVVLVSCSRDELFRCRLSGGSVIGMSGVEGVSRHCCASSLVESARCVLSEGVDACAAPRLPDNNWLALCVEPTQVVSLARLWSARVLKRTFSGPKDGENPDTTAAKVAQGAIGGCFVADSREPCRSATACGALDKANFALVVREQQRVVSILSLSCGDKRHHAGGSDRSTKYWQ